MAAAEALPKMLTEVERQRRQVYPDLANIRDISAHVAMEARSPSVRPRVARCVRTRTALMSACSACSTRRLLRAVRGACFCCW